MRFGDWSERLIFLCRAFAQAVLALTQRREARMRFGDWGEKLIFLCRAFGQVNLPLRNDGNDGRKDHTPSKTQNQKTSRKN